MPANNAEEKVGTICTTIYVCMLMALFSSLFAPDNLENIQMILTWPSLLAEDFYQDIFEVNR